MLRSTASLLSRSGVPRRVVRSSSAFMSSSSSVAMARQVSVTMQNSFVRSMNSASTIIEDDGSDYGFGESIPEQEIPEEFIEEGEETIVSHSKYILITFIAFYLLKQNTPQILCSRANGLDALENSWLLSRYHREEVRS